MRPSGHRPTLTPGRTTSPPASPPGPAGASDTLTVALAADALTAQIRRIADALEPDVEERDIREQTTADDVLRQRLTEVLTAEHYRRADERIVDSPEGHSAGMAAVVLPVVEQELKRFRAQAARLEPAIIEQERLARELETAREAYNRCLAKYAKVQRDRDQHAVVLRDVLAVFDRVTGDGAVQGYHFAGVIEPEVFERWRAVVAPTVERAWWEEVDQYEQEAVAATRHVLELKATLSRVQDVAKKWGEPYHCGWLSASVLVRQLREAIEPPALDGTEQPATED